MLISNRMPRVAIEYDCRGQRVTKEFDNAHEARRFYINKFNSNKNPKVKKAN